MAAATKAKRRATTRRKRASTEGAQILVSILLSNEGGTYIAQCLEWDIAAQDQTPTKALEAFEVVFWARVMRDLEKGRPILRNIEAAPDELWDQFRAGMPLQNAYPLKPPASVRVPRAEVTEIRLAA
jgi:hypothetical protein